MKKSIVSFILLSVCVGLLLFPHTALAEGSEIISGTCGDNIIWTFEGATLTILGTGDMEIPINSEGSTEDMPWDHLGDAVHTVIIGSGITSIAHEAFYWLDSVEEIWIPQSVISIGIYIFDDSSALETIHYEGSEEDWNAIDIWWTVREDNYGEVLPVNSTLRYAKKTYDCECPYGVMNVCATGICGENLIWILDKTGKLKILGTGDMYHYGEHGGGTDAPWISYAEQILMLEIEETVTSIGCEAFRKCTALISVEIPSGVTSIGFCAFEGCTDLRSVTIGDMCQIFSASPDAFLNCINLEDVYISQETIIAKASRKWLQNTYLLEYANHIYTINSAESVTEEISKGFACTNQPEIVLVDGVYYKMFTRGSHTYETSTTEPSCTENCATLHLCAECGYEYKDNVIRATGHDWNEEYICRTCGEMLKFLFDCGLEVEALTVIDGVYCTSDVNPVVIAVDAPLNDWLGGYSLYDYVETYGSLYFSMTYWNDLIGAMDDNGFVTLTEETLPWILDVITGNPKWNETESELTHYLGIEILRDQVCEHQYESVVTAPTCTEGGYATHTCTACGDTYTEEIPATGHSFADGICEHCGASNVTLGDANNDGKINARDVRALLRYLAGLLKAEEVDLVAADHNTDGKVNARDARAILRYLAGLD